MLSDISAYQPKFNESFFFDANIWIFLFCPIAFTGKRKQNLYSKFLADAQRSKSGIFINSLVLSEFANRYLRLEFDFWKKDPDHTGADYKKDFVGSVKYKEVIEEVIVQIRSILKLSEKVSDNFQAVSIENLFSEFGNCDFNDSYYIELSRMNNWKIVTDDADFFRNNKLGMVIISANIE